MFDNEEIKSYIEKLSNNDLFIALEEPEKEKAIFTSIEKLKDWFSTDKITIRAVAIQVLYNLEGEDEEYAILKRHGIKTYSVKGVSVTFEGSGISEEVLEMLTDRKKAYFGRLI